MNDRAQMVTVSEDGGLVVEMWHGGRKLTLDVRLAGSGFTQVWGPDVNEEMATGTVDVEASAKALFRWLRTGTP